MKKKKTPRFESPPKDKARAHLTFKLRFARQPVAAVEPRRTESVVDEILVIEQSEFDGGCLELPVKARKVVVQRKFQQPAHFARTHLERNIRVVKQAWSRVGNAQFPVTAFENYDETVFLLDYRTALGDFNKTPARFFPCHGRAGIVQAVRIVFLHPREVLVKI